MNQLLLNRKRYVGGLLEMACQELELPESKREIARKAYEAVANWLNDCPDLGLFRADIFPQGSIALGTTVKPLTQEEFDVDLVCLLTLAFESLPQDWVKRSVGNRLKQHGTYAPMLESFKRAWRLNYAEESQLHLDITPAVNHSRCRNGGLCVTDEHAKAWHPTHPRGIVRAFEARAALQPRFRDESFLANRREAGLITASAEPFPDHLPLKGLLRRAVQLVKRHRSIHFEKGPEKAPISIILTTLAAKAYEAAATSGSVYDTELDLLCDVIARMPGFIEKRWANSRWEWWVPNETTDGENFAEKWNTNPVLATAFFVWHAAASKHFRELADAVDAESTFVILNSVTGSRVGSAVRARATEAVSRARVQGMLRTAPSGLLGIGAGVPIRSNTFFGR